MFYLLFFGQTQLVLGVNVLFKQCPIFQQYPDLQELFYTNMFFCAKYDFLWQLFLVGTPGYSLEQISTCFVKGLDFWPNCHLYYWETLSPYF